MSRRRSVRQDSLELLLDTICNTFGGVLFIAILVVLLLQQTGGGSADSQAVEVPVDEFEAKIQTLAALSAEFTRLRANSESQNVIVSSFATDEVKELISRKRELDSKHDELRALVDTLLVENAQIAAKVLATEAENQKIVNDLEKAVASKKDAQERIDADRKGRTTEARLPQVLSKGFKQEIGVIVQYDRAYLWHEYDADNTRIGLNMRDFVVVGEEGGGLVTSPKPFAGIPLNGSETSKTALKRLLKRFDPSRCYLSPIVRPDSFDSFHHFRDQLIELGYNYRLMPVDLGSAVYDRGGVGSGVQ